MKRRPRFLFVLNSLICLLLIGKTTYAQDSFNSIEDLIGNKVVFYDAKGLFDKFGPFMSIEQKGKLKVVKDVSRYCQVFDNEHVFEVKSQETVKNKHYLLLTSNGEKYYVLLDSKKNYLENIRSYSFWEGKLTTYKEQLQLRQIPGSDPETHPCNQYKIINWSGFKMPESYASDVAFFFSESGIIADGSITSDSIERNLPADVIRINISKYITREKYNVLVSNYLERKEQERLDSITDLRPIIARVLHTYEAKNAFKKVGITYEEDDENDIRIYSCHSSEKYGKTKFTYLGFSLGNDLEFNESDLIFENIDDVSYLKRRGSKGELTRKDVAKESDLEYTKARIDSLHAEADRMYQNLKKIYSFYDKKKIFITGQDYVFGDYGQFGLSFKFYNCYSKQIKYVEIKMVPYNTVGDVQTDDIGRGVKEVRCIGPIEPEETATYEFEKIWWDERDIIEKVIVTRIKLIFKDNSSVVFSSKAQVDAHRSSNYSLAEMGVTE